MGTAVPAVGTFVNKGGYNPEVRVRGGRAPTRGAWAQGQGRVGEADGRAERVLLLGLERDTM